MDREQFTEDVMASLNDGLATDQDGDVNDSGLFVAVGETHMGALYGYEENNYGQRAFYLFDTEAEQSDWFDAVTEGL